MTEQGYFLSNFNEWSSSISKIRLHGDTMPLTEGHSILIRAANYFAPIPLSCNALINTPPTTERA
jgi:hypothetical protein